MAAQVVLTGEQMEWYEMAEEAYPHVTLSIHPKHQARDLDPMTKHLVSVQDWVDTQVPGLSYSPSEDSYRITHTTTNTVVLHHRQIERHHGREKTDHSQSGLMLDDLPEGLWSAGPTDVGFCSTVKLHYHYICYLGLDTNLARAI